MPDRMNGDDPMTKRRLRGPAVRAIAPLSLLVVLAASAPSVPSVPGPLPEPPSRDEIVALEELAQWVRGDRQVQVLTATDVAEAMREGRRSFELFRSYTDKQAHQDYVGGLPYGDQIFAAAERYDLDSLLVAAVVQAESGFRADAVSPVGAIGLMQVMPTTGQLYGVHDLTDPTANLDAGSRYMSELLDLYSGDLELALAAYNAGPGNVKRYGGVPPFPETRSYVERVLSAYVGNHRGVWTESGAAEQLLR